MKQILITVILCATALIALRIAIPEKEKPQTVIEAIHDVVASVNTKTPLLRRRNSSRLPLQVSPLQML